MIERSEEGTGPAAAADGTPPGWAPPPPPWAPPPGWAPPPPPWAPGSPLLPAPPSAADPSAAEVAAGPAHHRPDVPLNRQLATGGSPSTRGSAWVWVLFAALGFLAGQVFAALFITAIAAVNGHLGSLTAITHLTEPPTWYVVSSLLGLWAGFFGGAWLASAVRGTKSLVRDMGLRFRWIDLIGIPIGIGGQFLVGLMYLPIAQHVHNFNQRFNAPSQRLTGGSHGVGYVVIGICTVVGAPFFEELFFRGLILRSLARLFGDLGRWVGPALAIIISGVLFGLAHAESLQLLGLATFGIILSFISYRTGRLGMDMVAHASFNLVAVAAVVAPFAIGTRVLF